MSEHQNHRLEPRTVSFTANDRTWGYPLSHLLAMHWDCRNNPQPKGSSQIELYFSTETVVIHGDRLGKLWEALVANPPRDIGVSDAAAGADNEPLVKRIEILADDRRGSN